MQLFFIIEDILIIQLDLNKSSFIQANPKKGGFVPTALEIKRNLENEMLIEDFNKMIDKLKRIRNDKLATLHFFDWKLDFAEVMNEKVVKGNVGFDIVIGNPPYVDIKNLPNSEVRLFFEKFRSCENRVNLYSIFIEKVFALLARNGCFMFIVPNSLLINSSYKKIRKMMLPGINKLIKLPDAIFENAIVETIIFQIINNNQQDKIFGKVYPNNQKTKLKEIKFMTFERSVWNKETEIRFNIFSNDKVMKLLTAIEKETIPFISLADFSLGITPYDKYKGHSKLQIENKVFHASAKESEFHQPLISGKNILRYIVTSETEEFLKYGNWLGAPREKRFFTEPRIIVRQIVSGHPARIFAGLTFEELYFTQIGFGIIPKEKTYLRYLTALLNSNLINFYHKYKFLDIEKNVFQKILIANCKKFPIKKATDKIQTRINQLVDKIIEIKLSGTLIDTLPIEKEIDLIVYKLYNLSYVEVSIIEEGDTLLGKEEYENFEINQ